MSREDRERIAELRDLAADLGMSQTAAELDAELHDEDDED
jgi:hypothetical protein